MLVHEVLDRRHHTIPRAAFLESAPLEGQPALDGPGVPRHDLDVLAIGMPVLRGDPIGGRVLVAAGERPEDVMEEQQREMLRPLRDQPELVDQRVVVVIAIEHDGVGDREVSEGVQAHLLDHFQLGVLIHQLGQVRDRSRLDRDHASTAWLGPLEQLLGKPASLGAHLDDGLDPGRVEAGAPDLIEVTEGVPGLVRIRAVIVGGDLPSHAVLGGRRPRPGRSLRRLCWSSHAFPSKRSTESRLALQRARGEVPTGARVVQAGTVVGPRDWTASG